MLEKIKSENLNLQPFELCSLSHSHVHELLRREAVKFPAGEDGFRLRLPFLLLIFIIQNLPGFAQSHKEVFENAIDQMNFATIQYVLADDKQNTKATGLATSLEYLNNDSNKLIEKIIEVYGPNSKTQDLSIKISQFKHNFSRTKPVENQLDAVIEFISEDRKGKGYLADLRTLLSSIKEDALEKAAGLAPENDVNTPTLQAANSNVMPVNQTAGIPTYLTIAIVAIGIISLFNLWVYIKLFQRRRSSHVDKDDSYKMVRHSIDFEIYPRLEKNNDLLEKKIENLRQEVLGLMKEMKTQTPVANPPVAQQQKPVAVPEQKVTEPKPVQQISITPGKVVELRVNKPQAPEPVKPVKKYADYPKENGFIISQLQDVSDRRSIYELTILPDSDYANFTIVDNRELHEYAIQNRERLLKDACDFEISSSLHTRIEVIKAGKLVKNGNTWQIQDKAQIKFV